MKYYKIKYFGKDLTYYISIETGEIKTTEEMVDYLKECELIYEDVTADELDRTAEWCEIGKEEFEEGCWKTQYEGINNGN